MKKGTEVAWVGDLPPCDITAAHGPAVVDARTIRGTAWAYLCQDCWEVIGVRDQWGKLLLGTGHGQRLVRS